MPGDEASVPAYQVTLLAEAATLGLVGVLGPFLWGRLQAMDDAAQFPAEVRAKVAEVVVQWVTHDLPAFTREIEELVGEKLDEALQNKLEAAGLELY